MARRSDDVQSAHTAVSPTDPTNPGIGAGKNLKPETVHQEGNDVGTKRAEALGLELGSERRKHLERKLKIKLDLRFSILVRPPLSVRLQDREC